MAEEITATTKACSICRRELPLSEFRVTPPSAKYPRAQTASSCRPCDAARCRLWRQEHPRPSQAKGNYTKGKFTVLCAACGTELLVFGTDFRRFKHHFCSNECRYGGLFKDDSGPTVVERFLRKISVTEDGCWPWVGGRSGPRNRTHRYGRWRLANGKVVFAHRFSYELFVGPITDGLFICHHCDNPPCVNPDHLFLGTHADNMRDMREKGRGPKGERHGHALLTDEKVRQIRALSAAGESHQALGKQFGTHPTNILYIVNGRAWKHVS